MPGLAAPEFTRQGSWAASNKVATRISLKPGMHSFNFTDRDGRAIPVHYYISGDFSIGVDDEVAADEDAEDEAEQGAEVAEDGRIAGKSEEDVADDEEPEELGFEEECLKHEEAMISQSVLFVCHGVLRNAKDYCKNWITLAERFNLMVVCPEFTDESFPDTMYNYGGVQKGKNRRTWGFTSIEYIFDTLLLAGMKKDGYSLFGHSAGAQFAHRFCLFAAPGSRCLQIVCANAGWYTLPVVEGAEHTWPYSLQKGPVKFTAKQLEVVFSRRLLVLLGQEDVGLKYLRVEPGAQAQGNNRFERGIHFFTQARKMAAALGFRFNWSLRTVANVGHANKHMAFIAATHLFSVSKAHRPEPVLSTVTDSEEEATED